MRRWERRNNESVMWAIFAGGGQLAVIVVPALVIVFGFLVPLGVFGDPATTYAALAVWLTNPLISFVVFAIFAVLLWHCFHRGYHALHDLQIEPPEIVRFLTYAAAVAIPMGAWAYTLWIA